jgi:hypothetical protein
MCIFIRKMLKVRDQTRLMTEFLKRASDQTVLEKSQANKMDACRGQRLPIRGFTTDTRSFQHFGEAVVR